MDLKNTFYDLLRLLFPKSCPGCSEELKRQEEEVCFNCLAELQETNYHLSPDDNDLFRRFAGRVPLEGASAFYFYDKKSKAQQIIYHIKYGKHPRLGKFMGKLYGNKIKEGDFLAQAEIIIPVPLHPSKLAKRTYNQAEEICFGLSEALSIPVRSDLLIRTRKTETQTRKDKDDRWANVDGGFKAQKNIDKHVLLVDDVITTGATLAASVKALYQAPNPPKSVRILSLGVARKE